MGEVIAVLSGKGGTGKTSICAGIAAAMAQHELQILCVDCDVGLRNLDISLGMAQVSALSFVEAIQYGCDFELAAAHPEFSNLHFFTAPVNCTTEQVDEGEFRTFLDKARERYQYIFLDAPAGIEGGFQLAARYADRVILVTGPDPASIRDAGRTGEVLELMKKADVRLIVNRISRKLATAMGLTVDDIMDQAGLPLLGLVPEDPNVIMAAVSGESLLTFTNRGAAAACRRIARRIQGYRVKIHL